MSNNVPPEHINPVTNGFKLGRSTCRWWRKREIEREREEVIEISNGSYDFALFYKRRKRET